MRLLSLLTIALTLQCSIAGNNISKSDQRLKRAFNQRKSEFFIRFRAKVLKRLPTDNYGIRHQQFLVQLSTDQTLLVAHNIDLSSRITGLRKNTFIRIFGEYIWTRNGGIIHLTHRRTSQNASNGWIKYRGIKYQ